MGQRDLGTCIILSLENAKLLNLDFKELEFVGEVKLNPVQGIFDSSIKRKLRKRIEKIARNYDSDLAVIHTQHEMFGDFIDEISYSFGLYKYK